MFITNRESENNNDDDNNSNDNDEYDDEGDNNQCDQMLKHKVAQVIPKVAQKGATVVFNKEL